MAQPLRYEEVSRALDFVAMPLGLEVLQDLVFGREPDVRGEAHETLETAVRRLIDLGAARACSAVRTSEASNSVEITPAGTAFYWRLVDIEELAASMTTTPQSA